MKNLITLTTFEYPFEAQVIKSKLESEDIYVFLKDELTIQIDNFLSNAIGGVKLQVFEKDVAQALKLLKVYDVKIYERSKPEKFAVLFQNITNKIPVLNKVSVENRGVVLILLIIAIPIIITSLFFL